MEGSGIMEYLMTDDELQEMRKEWKELGIGTPFPPFNYDEFDGLDGYKETIRERLNSYRNNKKEI